MDDIEIKKLFNDDSINTNNNIKIEKNGTIINFDIKKIIKTSNENKLINNKIEEIKKTLGNINDNVIIYIKPLKQKSNIINKNKVDYIFLKKRQNNSENKLKTKKFFSMSLFPRGKTNSENDLKKTNFENDLKNKIKYFKLDDIFLEIVNIINLTSNNNVNYFSNTLSVKSNSTNTLSEISNLPNNINTEFYTNTNNISKKEKTKYYFILGLGCSKKQNKKKIYEGYFKETNGDVEIICESYSKAVYTIGKRLIGKPPSSNSKYLLNIQNNILKDLKIYKEVIVIGHSFGGSLVSRIAKNLNNEIRKNLNNEIRKNLNNKITKNLNDKITKNLKMYTVGSIYIPQEELKHINIIHFMNFSDISLRLSKTNYTSFEKNLETIKLPYEWGKIKTMEYYISNNKQIFYININSNNNKSLLSRITPTELKKHNDYGYIQYCILNSEKFRSDLSSIIDRVKLTEISKQ